MARESWNSKLGFILVTAGSAIGLANIVRFPYLVGEHGGAAFILVYLMALLILGLPVFLGEIALGRYAQRNPVGAYKLITDKKRWQGFGLLIVATGLLVSAFYAALAGWVLGYFVAACRGLLHSLDTLAKAQSFHQEVLGSVVWCVGYQALFLALCVGALRQGVRRGIEKLCEILMPIFFVVLIALACYGLSLPAREQTLAFLFAPKWAELTRLGILLALGQAFFTLSLGQGTLITYGSYLPKDSNLFATGIPIVITDTLVSIVAAIAVFSVVFANNVEPNSGLGLMFHSLPLVFAKMSYGQPVAILFFLLVTLAALTSEISALEPMIAYLSDEHGFSRKRAVMVTGATAFVLGIPSALSFNLLSQWQIAGKSIIETMDFLATGLLIPICALATIVLVGWVWGIYHAYTALFAHDSGALGQHLWLQRYFKLTYRYVCPLLILLILFSGLGG